MLLNVCYHIAPKAPTVQASMVCDHFGLTLDGQQQVIARDLELPVTSGNLIAFVGPSGSGKSSLMRAVAAELNALGQGDVLWLDHLPQVSSLVADALALPPLDAFRLLAQCGLAEPQLLLRTPDELSDGQRFRFRLAQSVAESVRRQSQHSSQGAWIVADEFTSPLDRTLAKVMARNWHSLLRQHRLGGLVATTYTDILDDLEPDVIVECSHQAAPVVHRRGCHSVTAQHPREQVAKKKKSASSTSWPSPPERNATGRILLGGITARTPSALSALSPSSGISTNR